MKIYIITSGAYSDYGIERVFLSEEKAKSYCELHNECRIEEYDTFDDNYIIPEEVGIRATIVFEISKDALGKFYFYTRALETEKEEITLDSNKFSVALLPNYYYKPSILKVTISKLFETTNITEDGIKDKMIKIGQDICTKIEAMIIDGNDDINFVVKNVNENYKELF